jgi:hypothetical protein
MCKVQFCNILLVKFTFDISYQRARLTLNSNWSVAFRLKWSHLFFLSSSVFPVSAKAAWKFWSSSHTNFTLSVRYSHLVTERRFCERYVTHNYKMSQRDYATNLVYLFCNVPKELWPPGHTRFLNHTQRRATVGRTPLGRVTSSSQRPLPDNTQHTQQNLLK